MPSIKVPSIFTAVDKFTKPVSRMERKSVSFTKKLNAGMTRVNRVVDKFTPALGAASKQLLSFVGTAAIAAGILATLNFSVNEIKEYQQNMQSLQAITGVTSDQFKEYKQVIFEVAGANRVAGKDIAKTFEIIASDIPSLLTNAKALGQVADAAVILSKASGDELNVATTALTGTLNQFNLKADQSKRVIDAMAAGNIAGNVSVSQLAEGTDKFGKLLAGMNGKIEDAVALQEVLGTANLKGAEAGTKLRGVLLKLSTAKTLPPKALDDLKRFGVNTELVQDKSISLSKRLREISKIAGDEGALKNVFGEQNLVAAATLLRSLDQFDDVLNKVSGPNAVGKAAELAATKTNTLVDAFGELRAQWSNIINGSERTSVVLGALTKVVFFLANNLETVVGVLGIYLGVIIAVKVATVAVRAATVAWNIVVGISNVLQGKSIFAIRGNTVAMTTQAVATKAITAAQKAWILVTKGATIAMRALSVALSANPIGAIILAIVALGFAVREMIKNWEKWGRIVALITGPFGTIIFIIKSLHDRWNEVTAAFREGGIIGAIKAIGRILVEELIKTFEQMEALLMKVWGSIKGPIIKAIDTMALHFQLIKGVIFNFLLKPLKAVLAVSSKIGIGEEAFAAIQKIEAENKASTRAAAGQLGIGGEAAVQPVNLQATQETINTERSEQVSQGQLDINVNSPGGAATVDDSKLGPLPVKTTETFNFD